MSSPPLFPPTPRDVNASNTITSKTVQCNGGPNGKVPSGLRVDTLQAPGTDSSLKASLLTGEDIGFELVAKWPEMEGQDSSNEPPAWFSKFEQRVNQRLYRIESLNVKAYNSCCRSLRGFAIQPFTDGTLPTDAPSLERFTMLFIQHNLPPLTSIDAIEGLTYEHARKYFQGYYPDGTEGNESMHGEYLRRKIKEAIGCSGSYFYEDGCYIC
ncbi:hypothetical protein BDQ17DRAFT_1536805 [Cyathus striatus]|nr:hypothetical protein BDQ17DRAFT_1536805 [Cyathus striatus]